MLRFRSGLLISALLLPGRLLGQSPPTTSAVHFTGYLQARETYQRLVGLSGSINRARLAAYGGISAGLTWRIQGEFRTGSVGTGKASVSLQDAYARFAEGGWAV